MSFKERFKTWWFKFRIFLWFIGTEPVRQFREVFKLIGRALNLLDHTLAWAYVALIFVIMSLIVGKQLLAALFLFMLLFVIFIYEWNTGYFMHRYRQESMRKLKQKEKTLNEAHDGKYKEGDNWTEQSEKDKEEKQNGKSNMDRNR